MTVDSSLFKLLPTHGEAPARNREGFPCFKHSLPEQALQVLLTGTLSDTFYMKAESVTAEAVQVLQAMKQEDPDLLARMIVYAREAGCLRLLPTMATVLLSTAGRPDLFEAVFARVVRTPRELRNFLVLSKRTPLRKGLGRCTKRAVGRYLRGLSDYSLLKYGSSDGPFSLRDAVRLVRPRPRDAREALVFRMLTHGRGSISPDSLERHFPQAHAFMRLQQATTSEEAIRCITEGRLPPEVVLGALKPDVDIWRALAPQMPMLALLRHLATLVRTGAFEDAALLDFVCEQLGDRDAIRASRVLPFRYYAAWKALDPTELESQGWRRPLSGRTLPPPLWYPINGGPDSKESTTRTLTRLRWALEKAVDLSLDNLALPTGKVCLALDVSCSMESPVGKGSSVRLARHRRPHGVRPAPSGAGSHPSAALR